MIMKIVGERGLEPPWDYSHTALNRARLPVSPLARIDRKVEGRKWKVEKNNLSCYFPLSLIGITV